MSEAGRFLSRWSRLKRGDPAPAPAAPAAAPVVPTSAAAVPASASAPEAALPPVESLDFAADFTAFLKDEVSESVRRAALRKLFQDPRFNVMDGLDVYIDDYSCSTPIPPDLLERLKQFETLLKDDVPPPDSPAEPAAGARHFGAGETNCPAAPESPESGAEK